jgi:drug/metabolite transporter (DMT)-like permease
MQPAAAEPAPDEGAVAGTTPNLLPWVALLTVYFVWGTTYIGIRVAVRTMPPLLMGGIRFVIAGAILYVFAARARGGEPPARPTPREWRSAAIAAVPMFLIANGCVTWGETRVDAGIASLLVATVPLWLVLLDAAIGRHRIAVPVWAGLVVGFTGVALLVHPTATHRIDPLGAAALLCTALAWAVGSLYIRGSPAPAASPLLGPAMQMLLGGVMLLVAGVLFGELPRLDPGSISTASLWGLVWLIGPGAIVGLSAYTFALKRLPTATVATYAYVNPLVAVSLGALLLGEAITVPMLTGGGLILLSVAVIVGGQRVARRPTVT